MAGSPAEIINILCDFSDIIYTSVPDYLQEHFGDDRIELSALVSLYLINDVFARELLTIDSVGIHGIERIRHADRQ